MYLKFYTGYEHPALGPYFEISVGKSEIKVRTTVDARMDLIGVRTDEGNWAIICDGILRIVDIVYVSAEKPKD